MLLPDTIPNMSTIAILFHKPSHCEFALANIIFAENSTIGMQTMSYVEFQVEFTTEMEVIVLNSKSIGSFATPDHIVKYQFRAFKIWNFSTRSLRKSQTKPEAFVRGLILSLRSIMAIP